MTQHTPQKWFNLEEVFYKSMDQKLIEKLRAEMDIAKSAEEISTMTGINNPELASELAKLHITTETLSAFRLVPLIAVAWADDRVEENERYVIMKAAKESGIPADGAAMHLLEAWTTNRPGEELLSAWCDYARALSASLASAHREELKKEVMNHVEAVAKACGGVLRFGSISASEKAIMDRIESALS